MSSIARYGSDVPTGGLVDARDRDGCLVVTGLFDHVTAALNPASAARPQVLRREEGPYPPIRKSWRRRHKS